ncbi:hypothetical protein, variant 2 [Capsaspora owczarzaki ATCC 30864]|uniref:Uncharacterized protein n=1 Tax=Capsaspora owczarzaki (strain ATCC 30864) TaxID=595528 RepID=A0A0D2VIG9_CAPO3|nr:hypothetical protein CAOG_001204 [Capsaspora owczarzaki ATCC 30864]KJE89778.1 hypothetical protein, variant 1 [Capsaspora owczarzaki ATCC 30864]KJE89779.1 hypothetical protein, variant 2 [Capsaspora owczarzaki ATCC 30864]
MQFRREREVGFGNSGLLGIVFQLLACAMRYTHCYTTTGTHGARHGARGQSRTVPKRRNCFKGGFCRIHQGAGYGCFLKCEAACVLRYATLTCIDIGLPAFCMYIVTWAESTQSLAFQLFKRNAEGTIRTLHEKNKTMSTQLLQLQESGTVQSQEMFRKKWQQALALLTAERDAHAATRAELAHGRRPKAVVGSATSSAAATSATLSDSTPQVNKVPHITRKKPRLQQPAPVAANPVVTVSSSAPAKDNWAIEGDMDIDLS